MKVMERLCHTKNPDMAEEHYTPQERVCQRLDKHDGPHMGIIGRSRWVYPGTVKIAHVQGRTAVELIALAAAQERAGKLWFHPGPRSGECGLDEGHEGPCRRLE